MIFTEKIAGIVVWNNTLSASIQVSRLNVQHFFLLFVIIIINVSLQTIVLLSNLKFVF